MLGGRLISGPVDTLPNAKPARHLLAMYPTSFVNNTLLVAYEYSPNQHWGFRLKPGFTTSGQRDLSGSSEKRFGLSNEIQARYYLESQYFDKFSVFAAAYASAKYLRWRDPVYSFKRDLRASAYSSGLLLGFQVLLGGHFFTDLYLGGGYQKARGDALVARSNSLNTWRDGITPRFGLNCGWKF